MKRLPSHLLFLPRASLLFLEETDMSHVTKEQIVMARRADLYGFLLSHYPSSVKKERILHGCAGSVYKEVKVTLK